MSEPQHKADFRKVNLTSAPCAVCALLRKVGAGACLEHTVHEEWWLKGHGSPWEAAASYLVHLDELFGQALGRSALAHVGAACVAHLRRPGAVERDALRADQTDRGLLRTLGVLTYQMGGDA